jgi:hypothetical protein
MMGINKILLVFLVVVGIIMIYLGLYNGTKLPPVFSGIGFIIIVALFLDKGKKN